MKVSAADLIPQSTTRNPPLSLKGRVTTFYARYKGHKLGPYYVRRWKENGKQMKEYVKPNDLLKIQAACEQNRQDRNARIARSRQVTNLSRNMSFLWRLMKRSRKAGYWPHEILHFVKIQEHGMSVSGCPPLRAISTFMAPLLTKWARQFAHSLPNESGVHLQ
jgi:hypothetical protein